MPETPQGSAQRAHGMLRDGEPLLAYDVVREALQRWPDDPGLRALEGLALARCGAAGRANQALQKLYDQGRRDEETVSLLARTHKDLGLAGTGPDRRQHLQRAQSLYAEAYEPNRSGHTWSGINAAALALLLDDTDQSRSLAAEIAGNCRQALARMPDGDPASYWPYATLAEACLLLGEFADARRYYTKAAALPSAGYGSLASTRRNARLILARLQAPADWLTDALPSPRVVVFTGHMMDGRQRDAPRFPAAAEEPVGAALQRQLAQIDARVGFSSAACGADILFLETMLARGAEINVVLPSAPVSFARDSVEASGGQAWRSRFDLVLRKARRVVQASEQSGDPVTLSYANALMLGLARSRCRQLDGELRALSVWDGTDGARGGTASAVGLWRACGEDVLAIDPLTREHEVLPATGDGLPRPEIWLGAESPAGDEERTLVALMFGDAVGFSRLEEQQIPRFVRHFLQPIARLLDRPQGRPIVRNTWGDAVYLVFEDVRAAGLLALDICDTIAGTDWPSLGLPPTLGIRIALHAGPAYPVVDPILRQRSYTGVQVSRAARIEPITPTGEVYASQEFAAMAEATRVNEFFCEYVGLMPLAKNYGAFPTYRVRRPEN